MSSVHDLAVFVDQLEETHCARSLAYVATPRGVAYCQCLLAAQMKLQDGALSAMAPYIPTTVLRAVDLELRDAALAPEVERRMRALAAATKKTMRINSLEIETVTLRDGVIYPDRIRERIRAEGPTAPRFDRQHLDKDGHVSI